MFPILLPKLRKATDFSPRQHNLNGREGGENGTRVYQGEQCGLAIRTSTVLCPGEVLAAAVAVVKPGAGARLIEMLDGPCDLLCGDLLARESVGFSES